MKVPAGWVTVGLMSIWLKSFEVPTRIYYHWDRWPTLEAFKEYQKYKKIAEGFIRNAPRL